VQIFGIIEEKERELLVMGFYDAKGYWRNDGDGFYDAKGYFRSSGDGFYDTKGYFRSPGEGFYDAKGNWVSPGGSFYDSRGYCRSVAASTAPMSTDTGEGMTIAIGFMIFLPVALLWMMISFLVELITEHLYIVFIGYAIIDVVLSLIITKRKRHRGTMFVLSYIGNYLCMLSAVYLVLIDAVPSVIMNAESFGSVLEFTIVLMFVFGCIAIVQFFNYYHEKAVLEFLVGIAFFIIVIILLKNGTKEIDTIESLAQVYGVKASALFKALFGFAI